MAEPESYEVTATGVYYHDNGTPAYAVIRGVDPAGQVRVLVLMPDRFDQVIDALTEAQRAKAKRS